MGGDRSPLARCTTTCSSSTVCGRWTTTSAWSTRTASPTCDRIGVEPEAHLRTLAEHHVQAANTHWRRWTPELLAAARAAGVLAFGSLIGHPGQMARALGVGLDGIYVDHIEAILDELPEDDR